MGVQLLPEFHISLLKLYTNFNLLIAITILTEHVCVTNQVSLDNHNVRFQISILSSYAFFIISGLPDDLSTLDIKFKFVDLQDQSTVQTFVENLIQHLLFLHPTQVQKGALNSLEQVDKQVVFRRFFWRSVSATRSCENLMAL